MPSAGQGALGKEFLEKKIKHLCQGPDRGHSAKNFFLKNKTSLLSACRVGTRQSDRQRGRRRDGRFSLPSAPGALGKAFAKCPIKDTRQRGLCRSIFYRVFFTECRTLGKEPESSSEHLQQLYCIVAVSPLIVLQTSKAQEGVQH